MSELLRTNDLNWAAFFSWQVSVNLSIYSVLTSISKSRCCWLSIHCNLVWSTLCVHFPLGCQINTNELGVHSLYSFSCKWRRRCRCLRCDFSHKSLSENSHIVRYVLRVCKPGEIWILFSAGDVKVPLLNAHLTDRLKWKESEWQGTWQLCGPGAGSSSYKMSYRDTPEMQAGTLTSWSAAALPRSGGRPEPA